MDAVIELEISAGPTAGSYAVHVVTSLAGGTPSATVDLDADAVVAALPNIESGILASSVSARRVMSPHESAVQRIGVDLFDKIFTGKIGEAYRASAAVAAERGVGSQLLLRLTAPELAALPWETLYDTDAGRYVSRKEPLVRRVASRSTGRQGPIPAPLRILGMVSAPRGLQMLDVEAERERLESALAEHIRDGRVELVWLEDTSWGGLHNMLLRETWHVLHFIGHGGYDPTTDEGLIALVGPDGRADFVPASSFADLLNEASTAPRLVVLNSCQSGATGATDLFSGTAASLVHSGINAVVAMQFAVSDYAALAFARGFYVALASGRRIEEAVRSGRIGILGISRETLEWITPVLYLGGDDTRLLDPAALTAPRAVGGPVGDRTAAGAPESVTGAAEPPSPTGTVDESAAGAQAGAAAETDTAPATDTAATQEAPTERGLDAPTAALASGPPPGTAAAFVAKPGSATPASAAASASAATAPAAPPPLAPPAKGVPGGAASGPERRRRGRALFIAGIAAGVLVLGGGAWAITAALSNGSGNSGGGADVTVDPAVAEVTVPGTVEWTPTGVQCEAGDRLDITAEGSVMHAAPNPESAVGPDGVPDSLYIEYNVAGLPDAPHTALIGSIDRSEPFLVGADYTLGCPATGELFLGVNDVGVANNGGAFFATITTEASITDVAQAPVELPAVAVDVQAAQTWTPTGVPCDAGDVLRITASGEAFHNQTDQSNVTPEGLVNADGTPDVAYFPFNLEGLPATATASLVGSLDQQQPFFAVGSSATYTCDRPGTLDLGINDTDFDGNHGAWQASIVRVVDPHRD